MKQIVVVICVSVFAMAGEHDGIKSIATSKMTQEQLKSNNVILQIDSLKTKYEAILKNKDNEILYLKNKINSKNKTIILEKEICENANLFPQLMMKDSAQKDKHIEITKTPKEIKYEKNINN